MSMSTPPGASGEPGRLSEPDTGAAPPTPVEHGPATPASPDLISRLKAELTRAGMRPELHLPARTSVDLRDAVCGFATELVNGTAAADIERWATGLLRDSNRFVPVIGGPIRGADVIRVIVGIKPRVETVEREGGRWKANGCPV